MKLGLKMVTVIVAGTFWSSSVWADEKAEAMVQEALPLMYHTCISVIEESDGDDLYVLDVIEKMTALSLYNREINVEELSLTEVQKADLRVDFLAALQSGCAEDSSALLAGVVDAAVRSSTKQ